MIMGTEIEEVSRFLKMKHINIPSNNDWLCSCVECFKDQGSYNLKQLKELVYQQWLLADLADIGVQVLPQSCLSAEKVTLQGRYAVQLNFFVNVAVSFHKQLQKLRRPEVMKNLEVDSENTPNNRETVSGSRTLKIEITDGAITVVGFEDHFIPSLQEPFVPGKKAVLIGPIECRKGILFLRPSNVQLLGGEVDALHITNAAENILARALKLPENPDPYHLHIVKEEVTQGNNTIVNANNGFDDDDEALMMLADVIENEVTADTDMTQYSTTSAARSNLVPNSVSHKPAMSQQGVHNQNLNNLINDQTLTDDFDREMAELDQKINANNRTESIKFDDDFELLENQTSLVERLHGCSSSVDDSTMTTTEFKVFDVGSSKKQYEQITELKRKLNESYSRNEMQPSTSGNVVVTKNSSLNSVRNEKIIVDYLSDAESPLTSMASQSESKDVSTSLCSNVDEQCDNFFGSDPFPPTKRPALVQTPGRVVKVLKKPKLKDDKWSVNAIVSARGIEMEVTFASDVIDKIFTISAAEIIARRKELVSDPVMKHKMNETLKNSQMRFSTLSCVMVFCFKDAISKPVIVDIE